jgi:AAA domain
MTTVPAPDPATGPIPAGFSITVETARQICALPDPDDSDQLLGPLLRRGARTIVGGQTGDGKSTLVARMLAAFVKGEEFLGWQGVGGKALVLDLEQGLRSVQRGLREAGLADCDDLDYARIPEGLSLDKNDVQKAAIERLLAANKYDVVSLDPYYKAHTGDSNDERQVDDLMRVLDLWRSRYGFALILPAHCRKPAPGAPLTFTIHDLAGSGAFVRGAEIVLGLRRLSDGYSRLYFFKDRDGDLAVGKSWGLLFDRTDGFRRDGTEGEERDLRGEVLELAADGKWRTMSEWVAAKKKGGVGASKEKVQAVLNALVLSQEVEHAVGPEGRGRGAKCWRGWNGGVVPPVLPSLFEASSGPRPGGVERVEPPYIGSTLRSTSDPAPASRGETADQTNNGHTTAIEVGADLDEDYLAELVRVTPA